MIRYLLLAALACLVTNCGTQKQGDNTLQKQESPRDKGQDPSANYLMSYNYGEVLRSTGPDGYCVDVVQKVAKGMAKSVMTPLQLALTNGEVTWNKLYKIGTYDKTSWIFVVERPASSPEGYPMKLSWTGRIDQNVGEAYFSVAKGDPGSEEPICQVVVKFSYTFQKQ